MRNGWRPVRAGAAIGLCLFAVSLHADEDGDLQARIDRAARLNVTASLEESQAALDALKPYMDQATPRQRDRVTLLRARNQVIAGNYDEAIGMVRPLREGGADPDIKLDAFRLSANAALNRDHFEDGYRFLRAGLNLLPEVDDPVPKVRLLAVAQWFFGMAGEPGKAIEYSTRALKLAQESGDPRMNCIALGELSQAQQNDGNLAAATAFRRQAMEACEAAFDPIMIAVSYSALGDLLVQQGHVDDGLEAVREGLERNEAAGYLDGVLNSRLSLGSALLAKGQPDKAKAILEPLAGQFEKLEFWRNVREAHQLLERIAEGRGDYRAALAHQHAADNADRKLLGQQRSRRVAYLQTEFDISAKEQQIELLREKNEVLGLTDKARRQQQLLSYGGLAAVSVIGVLLFLLLMRSRSDRRYLLWLSQHDGLTGLRNHSSFFRQANEALVASRGAGQPFSLVVADIDYFKIINDQHGHVVGDSVLRQVGRTLREVFGPVGIVGRIGGEEFAMALPGIRRERARELITELRERLHPVYENGALVPLTMSYGVMEVGDSKSTEFMRRFADEALYEAKRRGRDRIVDAADISSEAARHMPLNRRADDPR